MGEPKLLVFPVGGPRGSSPRAAGRGSIPLATGSRPGPTLHNLPLQHQLTGDLAVNLPRTETCLGTQTLLMAPWRMEIGDSIGKYTLYMYIIYLNYMYNSLFFNSSCKLSMQR